MVTHGQSRFQSVKRALEIRLTCGAEYWPWNLRSLLRTPDRWISFTARRLWVPDILRLRTLTILFLLYMRRMTSYRVVAVPDNRKFELDRNQNITKQPQVVKVTPTSFSDDEDREEWEQSSSFRGRSQSLKNLNEREESGSISRSKSLRDVDTGDFAGVSARVSHVENWNPVNPVGRGRIAERVQSWEYSLDNKEEARERKTSVSGMDRRKFSGSGYSGARKLSYERFARNGAKDWREDRGIRRYSQESPQHAYDNYGDPDRDQVRQCHCISYQTNWVISGIFPSW